MSSPYSKYLQLLALLLNRVEGWVSEWPSGCWEGLGAPPPTLWDPLLYKKSISWYLGFLYSSFTH